MKEDLPQKQEKEKSFADRQIFWQQFFNLELLKRKITIVPLSIL
jgi:hypothetical protein